MKIMMDSDERKIQDEIQRLSSLLKTMYQWRLKND